MRFVIRHVEEKRLVGVFPPVAAQPANRLVGDDLATEAVDLSHRLAVGARSSPDFRGTGLALFWVANQWSKAVIAGLRPGAGELNIALQCHLPLMQVA